MGIVPSQPFLSREDLIRYRMSSGLSSYQLEHLYSRFCELDRFEVVDIFFPNRERDARLEFDKFVEIFAIILNPQSGPFGRCKPGRAEKLRLLTQMFDCSQSECIKRIDFQIAMRYLLDHGGDAQEEEVEVELMLLEYQAFGNNTRNRISYEEFEERLLAADVDLTSNKWSSKDEYEHEVQDKPLVSQDSILKKLTTWISNYFLSVRDIFYQ
ncbi:uncharacterized protein LOC110188516 isoform X2 [Drosophila serrata]|uniref:uncharacterized protein LOC110188516 isoform X2 n=1 Tax=Drosophila serrata TaxID=7274 RepID=UPI000A1D0485|nr:uncharacterized protein LOC110188516 isoform X2 [Drosophila serrata]